MYTEKKISTCILSKVSACVSVEETNCVVLVLHLTVLFPESKEF